MTDKNILVINCGSSSLKFALINTERKHTSLTGIAQCLGTEQATITFNFQDNKTKLAIKPPYQHQQAFDQLLPFLDEIGLRSSIFAIGHRVVHGGEKYQAPTLINQQVLLVLEELCSIAPLHNPANIIGINAASKAFKQLPQVAVFDTAFHQTMPKVAFTYPIDKALYQQQGIRKYGFHGTSHYFVSQQAAAMVNLPIEQTQFITVHLGNGCSVAAVAQGKSVDTSMGFTPLAGVAMGTRCGDIDPGIIFHLINHLDYPVEAVEKLLNNQSGLLGVSGISNDCRTLEQAALEDNNQDAQLALDVFCLSIAKAIAAMAASLTQLTGVVFTGGIGENSDYLRAQIIEHLSLLNLAIDDQKNQQARFGKSLNIAAKTSPAILVIPTNEEWVIAKQTYAVTQGC
ncbi:acetate kinase [Colwellia sp. MEBiC06753]